MALRVLSVSYDESLLVTRQELLQRAGYDVVSSLTVDEATRACMADTFGLFILGHSIPVSDKHALIQTFRKLCPGGRILSLMRGGDTPIEGADNHVFSDNPQEFVDAVKRVISRSASRR